MRPSVSADPKNGFFQISKPYYLMSNNPSPKRFVNDCDDFKIFLSQVALERDF